MKRSAIFWAAMAVAVALSSCSVFGSLFKTKYQVLGEALVKALHSLPLKPISMRLVSR
jgi:hypothetical protein